MRVVPVLYELDAGDMIADRLDEDVPGTLKSITEPLTMTPAKWVLEELAGLYIEPAEKNAHPKQIAFVTSGYVAISAFLKSSLTEDLRIAALSRFYRQLPAVSFMDSVVSPELASRLGRSTHRNLDPIRDPLFSYFASKTGVPDIGNAVYDGFGSTLFLLQRELDAILDRQVATTSTEADWDSLLQ